MNIIIGKCKRQVKEIYNSSDKHYISEHNNNIAVNDDNIVNYVLVDPTTKQPLAYLSMYRKPDFVTKEEFDVDLDGIRSDAVYIWEIGTMKGHEGHGYASKLLREVLLRFYKKVDVYSCVEIANQASLALHEKNGFQSVETFEEDFFGRGDEEYLILKKVRHSKKKRG